MINFRGAAYAEFSRVLGSLPAPRSLYPLGPAYIITQYGKKEIQLRKSSFPVKSAVKPSLRKTIASHKLGAALRIITPNQTQYFHGWYHEQIAQTILKDISWLGEKSKRQICRSARYLDIKDFFLPWRSHHLSDFETSPQKKCFGLTKERDAVATAVELWGKLPRASARKRNVYLGWIIHLLTDMGTPAHVLGVDHHGDSFGKIVNWLYPSWREDDYEKFWNTAESIENLLPTLPIAEIDWRGYKTITEFFYDLAGVARLCSRFSPLEAVEILKQEFAEWGFISPDNALEDDLIRNFPREKAGKNINGRYYFFRNLSEPMILKTSSVLMPITLGVVRAFLYWAESRK